MKQNIRRIIVFFAFIVWDAFAVFASVWVSMRLLYKNTPVSDMSSILRYALLYYFAVVLINTVLSVYNSGISRFDTTVTLKLFATTVLSATLCYCVPRLFRIGFLSTVDYRMSFITALIMFILFCLGHGLAKIYASVLRYYFIRLFKRQDTRNVLIYGAGDLGTYLAHKFTVDTDRHPVGFVDDNLDMIGRTYSNVKVLGSGEVIERIIQDKKVEEVIIAINGFSAEKTREILEICNRNGCKLRRFGLVKDITSPTGKKLDMSDIDTGELIRRERVELDMETVKSFIEGKVVLVTGGAGSIGSEICNQVLNYGADKLIIFDFHENGLFHLDNKLRVKYDRTKYETVLGSVRDMDRLRLVFEQYKPQVVFHAAAHKHVPMMELNPCEAIKNNVFGTWNVANAADEFGIEKFILISTDKAVNPTNIMGASKRIAEIVIQLVDRKSKTQYAAVRFGNVLGSEGSVVPLFLEQIKKGGPVKVTHPEMKRYFMTIPEAVQLVLEAGAQASGGEIFVLDMGEPILISDLAADLIRLNGLEPNKDIDIIYTGLRPGEKLFEEISLRDEDVTKTQNNKIYVCKPLASDEQFMQEQAESLKKNAYADNREAVFETVKHLVPTFNHKK